MPITLSRRQIAFGRLWIAPEALAIIERLTRAAWGEGYDAPWPTPDDLVEIESSKWAEGALWIWVGKVRHQIPAGQWRLDQ